MKSASAKSGSYSRAWQGLTLTALVLMALALIAINDGGWQWNGQLGRIGWALGLIAIFALSWISLGRKRKAPDTAASDPPPAEQKVEVESANVLPVFYASQTGTAEMYAKQTAKILSQAGIPAHARSLEEVEIEALEQLSRALFIASTTDEGEPPYPVAGFVRRVLANRVSLDGMHYGLLALGDSYYEDFCAFGRQLDDWLQQQGAQRLFPRIDVDDSCPDTLESWQARIAELGNAIAPFKWQEPDFQTWRLTHRTELNPGSLGEPVFYLRLAPDHGPLPEWRAGAIAEIIPQNSPAAVSRWLTAAGLPGDAVIDSKLHNETLAERLARSELPDPGLVGSKIPDLVARLSPLRARDFSIASLPSDGSIDLLVRQGRLPDGRLGIGAGWVTKYAALGAPIPLRLRNNRNFHTPAEDVPLILIGNGTGLAGLRALLHERIAQGRQRNWLLFGERQRAHDFYFRDELESALAKGQLAYLDLAFSRDAPERIYVQHRLHEHGARLITWVDAGATICVCGSQEGMADGVDQALRDLLSDTRVQQLIESGRYLRDVY